MNKEAFPLYYNEKTGDFIKGGANGVSADYELIHSLTEEEIKSFIDYVNRNKHPLPLKEVRKLFELFF